jgi:hypothetical protein
MNRIPKWLRPITWAVLAFAALIVMIYVCVIIVSLLGAVNL